MKRHFRSFGLIALALSLQACTPPEIEVTIGRVGDRFVVGLTQDWGIILSRKRPPCVDAIDLRGASQIWRVEAMNGQCVELGGFTLGQTPAGFREVVRLPEDPTGTYHLFLHGIGSGDADITFP